MSARQWRWALRAWQMQLVPRKGERSEEGTSDGRNSTGEGRKGETAMPAYHLWTTGHSRYRSHFTVGKSKTGDWSCTLPMAQGCPPRRWRSQSRPQRPTTILHLAYNMR